MVDEQDSKSVGVFVCSNIESMKIEGAISLISREVLNCKPFDACCETSWSASIEDGDAIHETSSGRVQIVNTTNISRACWNGGEQTPVATVYGFESRNTPCTAIPSRRATTYLRMLLDPIPRIFRSGRS